MRQIVICLLHLILFGSLDILAQETGSIQGRITDNLDRPFQGAVVRVEGFNLTDGRRATTDETGV